jgi:hypothetical protein
LFVVTLLKTQLIHASLLFEQALALLDETLATLPVLAVAQFALLLL